MEESLDAYISQSLIDNASGSVSTAEYDGANVLGNELLLQLLLSSMGAESVEQAVAAASGTIDPSSLGGMDIDQHNLPVSIESETAGSNPILANALLSAVGPFADIAAAGSMHGDENMLVDSPVAAIDAKNAQPATTVEAAKDDSKPRLKTVVSKGTRAPQVAPQRQTIQQQALLHTAGKRGAPRTTASAAAATVATTPMGGTTALAKQPARATWQETPDGDDEDGLDGIDLKSLTSKERRQLRNKISARNFRVRRKEYITNLEAEMRSHKEEADGLRRELAVSKKDNAQLREEIQRLRQRLGAMGVAPSNSTTAATVPAAPVRPVSSTSARPAALMHHTRTHHQSQALAPNHQQPQQQPALSKPVASSMPVVRFNPHKDIPQSSAAKKTTNGTPTNGNGGSWAAKNSRSGFITVNTAILPSAHAATAFELLAEARRKQAVDALLDIGMPIAAPKVSYPEEVSDYSITFPAVLDAASLIAEHVLLQIALESSFAMLRRTRTTALPLLAIASC
ncbi:hypothetical protein COEREDRAFT_12274 [Coemansia reversa NRRL 1564]|uniref:BZIP domain-containing protein n=1 Tax=Coemansia reversa (strain ATCC 12441 / NRRL 1564) TaxID=763665 RepID=A0A2G5B211_COERN|nr:hypothetical protein COEREDRAFT_12274 [Coemansia reversa NRRL 1564]|eukprot:PIA12747.1 hypothetical protein COEREDRAFT_12274 [Coemansia reversa NRRL 1564]